MGVDCLKCINSACCKLVIEVNREEYDSLHKSVKSSFIKNSDVFIKKNPRYSTKQEELDEMYKDNFAEMNKSDDDLCALLDRRTMMCSVYDNRPSVCRSYTTDRCTKIREICTS